MLFFVWRIQLVECLTGDQRVASLSLTAGGVTPWLSTGLTKEDPSGLDMTEKLLTGM